MQSDCKFTSEYRQDYVRKVTVNTSGEFSFPGKIRACRVKALLHHGSMSAMTAKLCQDSC